MEIDEVEGVPLEEYVYLFIFNSSLDNHISPFALRYLTKIPRCIIQARTFRCPKCPHNGSSAPWPPLPKPRNELTQSGGFSEMEATANELVCWYTKRSYKQQLLGYPVHIPTRRDGGKDMKNMECAVDLLSHQAWTEGMC